MSDPKPDPVMVAVARVARASTQVNRTAHPGERLEAQRDLAAAKLTKFIAATIASAPPLTPEQRDALALLLRGSGDAS